LSEPIGAFNTFVLICSSVTIVLALEAARANKAGLAKGLVLLTLLLGGVFLGVKGFEYNHKFEHGIYPMAPRSRIYERADLYFASAVRERLNDAGVQKEITKLKGAPSGELDDEKRQAITDLDRVTQTVQTPAALDRAAQDRQAVALADAAGEGGAQ
jgi:hypothetical protein